MAEDLEKLYARLSLATEETTMISSSPLAQDSVDLTLCLAGKILAPCNISSDQILSLFKRLWNPKGSFSCKTVHDNTFLFSFGNILDKRRVIVGSPWLFDIHLLVINEVVTDVKPSTMVFSHCEFWIQLHQLPLGLMNRGFAEYVGNSIGEFIDVDADPSGSVIGKIVRIKVKMDITKPLLRVLHAEYHGQKHPLFLKYERLPNFCFHCGIIGHVVKTVNNISSIPRPPLHHPNTELGSALPPVLTPHLLPVVPR
ncbi:hypothetical protein DH2020_037427 [Rehmannia glutinosa]|uniref:DUF4283 domain-containing protein n=1 Tax=Rehmannia glutinosa TaxID=99300 RepID=A0ABR0V3B6_REHGL